MNTNLPILLLALCSLTVALHGCASFNDTLVVDIGDQVDLLELELAEGSSSQKSWAPRNGFECDFDAHSKRLSLFAGERHFSGKIRCRILEP
jgi:hypothetical protein